MNSHMKNRQQATLLHRPKLLDHQLQVGDTWVYSPSSTCNPAFPHPVNIKTAGVLPDYLNPLLGTQGGKALLQLVSPPFVQCYISPDM